MIAMCLIFGIMNLLYLLNEISSFLGRLVHCRKVCKTYPSMMSTLSRNSAQPRTFFAKQSHLEAFGHFSLSFDLAGDIRQW